MTQYAFYVNSSICTGCKTCQVSCQDKNDLTVDLLWRRVYDYGGGSWKETSPGLYEPDGVFRYFMSVGCNHCENPACVEACPTGAMTKDPETGIVTTDHEVCIGCESCAKACPYDAPVLDEANNYMTKCDMCASQVINGGKPECVLACAQRALDWGEIDEMRSKYSDAAPADVAPLPEPATAPGLLIGAHPKAEKSSAASGHVLNMEEEL